MQKTGYYVNRIEGIKEWSEKLFSDVKISYIKNAGHSIDNISKDIIKFLK